MMAKIYYNLIMADMWKLEDVPLRWKNDVKKLLGIEDEEPASPPAEETPSPTPEPDPDEEDASPTEEAVSYTHLTLPTMAVV